MADPNPLVHGDGFRALKAAGIKVRRGVLESQARELNRSFIKFVLYKKPYVTLKAAVSLDGKIATRSGRSQWITGAKARDFSHYIRATMDGVLVGAETVRRDNPSLTSHGKGRDPVRIVVSRSGRIPGNARIFAGKTPAWVFKGKKFSFPEFLRMLAAKGISRLLLEGGGETAAWALQSKEVDELMVYVAPLLIGGKEAKTFFEGRGFEGLKDALKLEKMEVGNLGEDVLIRGRLKN